MTDTTASSSSNGNNNDEQQPENPPGLDFTAIFRMVLILIAVQSLTGFDGRKISPTNMFTSRAPDHNGAANTDSSSPDSIHPIDANNHNNNNNHKKKKKKKPTGVTSTTPKSHGKKNRSPHKILWTPSSSSKSDTILDLDVYFTESPLHPYPNSHIRSPSKHNDKKKKKKEILAHWHESDLVLSAAGGDSSSSSSFSKNARNSSVVIPLNSINMLNNITGVYAHVVLMKRGSDDDDDDDVDDTKNVLYKSIPMTKYSLRKKKRDEHSLLKDNEDATSKPITLTNNSNIPKPNTKTILGKASTNNTHDMVLHYMKPSLTLQLVIDLPPSFPYNSIPVQLSSLMDFHNESQLEEDVGYFREKKEGATSMLFPATSNRDDLGEFYYPVLYPSEFWMKTDSLVEINGTLDSLEIELKLENIKMWKWQLMAQMEQSWQIQEETMGTTSSETDLLRSLLMDTNPWLLAVTAIVSMLHSLFDILAFKNDISFFKGDKSMKGLSVKTMIVNAFFQVVIFLYLCDEDTSYMVLLSNGVGLLIEFWKISKALTFTFSDGSIRMEETKSYKESTTKEYDQIAVNHLLFVTMPLVAGYGVYSLLHMKHKGWYSWVLSTLVGFIYMFGFVMMTPQLFINYKLQSVAHLNWRTLTYKSMNTFIDDLFAFVIKMPIMHRLACLRDDVIFFIFLYQKYKYRTDYTRVNEYGQCTTATDTAELQNSAHDDAKHKQHGSVFMVDQDDNGDGNGDKSSGSGGVRKRRGARDKSK